MNISLLILCLTTVISSATACNSFRLLNPTGDTSIDVVNVARCIFNSYNGTTKFTVSEGGTFIVVSDDNYPQRRQLSHAFSCCLSRFGHGIHNSLVYSNDEILDECPEQIHREVFHDASVFMFIDVRRMKRIPKTNTHLLAHMITLLIKCVEYTIAICCRFFCSLHVSEVLRELV